MADSTDSHNLLVLEFCELADATPEQVGCSPWNWLLFTINIAWQAQQYLSANRWDLPNAVAEYYTAQEEQQDRQDEEATEEPQEPEPYTGPRTLDGRPAPQATPSVASSSARPPRRGGIATLGSLNQEDPHAGHGHGHAHDDDDLTDSDEDIGMADDEPRDLFAGGEKSGLAVQDPSKNRNDPKKVVNDILKKARAWVALYTQTKLRGGVLSSCDIVL